MATSTVGPARLQKQLQNQNKKSISEICMVVTVGFSPEPPSPNTAEVRQSIYSILSDSLRRVCVLQNGGRYSTFEVRVPGSKQEAPNSRRFVVFASIVAGICLLLAVISNSSRNGKGNSIDQAGMSQQAIIEAIKLSMESESPEISKHRIKFLESLEQSYPPSMRENMNFSIDPCRFNWECI